MGFKISQKVLNNRIEKSYVTSICFNNDSSLVCSSTNTGTLIFNGIANNNYFKYDAYEKINMGRDNGLVRIYDNKENQSIHNFAFNDICDRYGFFSYVQLVQIRRLIFIVKASKIVKLIETYFQLTSVSFNLDGQSIGVGPTDGSILIYNLKNTNKPREILTGHKCRVNYVEFSKKATKPGQTKDRKNSSNTATIEHRYNIVT